MILSRLAAFVLLLALFHSATAQEHNFISGTWQKVAENGKDGARSFTNNITDGEQFSFLPPGMVRHSSGYIGSYTFSGQHLQVNLDGEKHYFLAYYSPKQPDTLYLTPANAAYQSACLEACFFLFVKRSQAWPGEADTAVAAIRHYVQGVNNNPLLTIRNITDSLTGESFRFYQLGPNVYRISQSAHSDFYFKDNRLVYSVQSVLQASRMGSCGAIEITTTCYFQNGSLIQVNSHKSANIPSCYPLQLSESEITQQAERLLRKFNSLPQ